MNDSLDISFKKRISYLRSIMRSGNKLDAVPRIEVSTIHASKGGERDNVMLLTDLSFGPYKSSIETPNIIRGKQITSTIQSSRRVRK